MRLLNSLAREKKISKLYVGQTGFEWEQANISQTCLRLAMKGEEMNKQFWELNGSALCIYNRNIE